MSIDVAALQELPPSEQSALAAQPDEFCCTWQICPATFISCFNCTVTG